MPDRAFASPRCSRAEELEALVISLQVQARGRRQEYGKTTQLHASCRPSPRGMRASCVASTPQQRTTPLDNATPRTHRLKPALAACGGEHGEGHGVHELLGPKIWAGHRVYLLD